MLSTCVRAVRWVVPWLGISAVVATATPQRSVAGRVVDETGAAVSGALVSLHSPLYVDRSVASGSNGEFTFTNVPVGVWSISASKRGYVRSMYSATTASGLPTVFDVTSSRQVDDMVIRLRRGGAITGRVTGPYGRPQERARVLAFRVRSGPDDWLDDDEAVAAAVTDGFGRYRLTDVSDGLYLIRAAARLTPPGVEIRAVSDRDIELAERILAGTRTEISTRKTAGAGPDAIEVTLIPTFFPGTIDSRSAAVVTVMAGQTSEGIDIAFSLSRAASVHGVVIRRSREAIAQCDRASLDDEWLRVGSRQWSHRRGGTFCHRRRRARTVPAGCIRSGLGRSVLSSRGHPLVGRTDCAHRQRSGPHTLAARGSPARRNGARAS